MKTVRVGREKCNDIVINDPYVTRMSHCEIRQDDYGNFSIMDRSKNGTYVDGMRIGFGTPFPLKEYSIVRIGNTTLPWRSYFAEDNWSVPEQGTRGEDIYGKPKTYLAGGIIAIILFSLLFGILCVIHASKVDRLWDAGDREMAKEESRKACMWFWWAFGIGMFRMLLYFIYLIVILVAM